MHEYLAEKGFVDLSNVKECSIKLTENVLSDIDKAKILYHYVRDEIRHSADINETRLTRYASEVLEFKHGICFTKSILLVAMLRSVSIPSGFGYQKLILDDEHCQWLVLHSYVFIYLDQLKRWIKVDPRGNKNGINAEFSVGKPKMAFEIREKLGEMDQNINHAYPVNSVIKCLNENNSREGLWKNLPADF